LLAAIVFLGCGAVCAQPQGPVIVRPTEIDDVLVNPGIGFTTFQRFNGDRLNEGTRWTEGYAIEYQPFNGNVAMRDHPLTSIAYFRIYWKFVEPKRGAYDWEMLDKAMRTARERGQSLMLRIAPYGTNPDNDVPAWYRELTREDPNAKLPVAKWRVDPENPAYAKYFGDMIKAVAARYDGHPDLELVDISIIGAWGEGSGSELLSDVTRRTLLDSYLDSFRKTPLVIQPNDLQKGPRRWDSLPGAAEPYALSKKALGWRVDCLGDMPSTAGPPRANWGAFPGWSHMLDFYPEVMVELGLRDVWIKAPVTMEACGVMQSWKNAGRDVDYIIDQSLKWHISSFNGKSSAVPEEWWPQVNRWLKKMGYRFVLRRFTYPAIVQPNEKVAFTSWWENKGVAPCYRRFALALRLKGKGTPRILVTDADIRSWLPGDNLYDNAVFIPPDMERGEYDLQIGLVDPGTRTPKVRLAIAGVEKDGWYNLGKIRIN
jgi:hypothetical protein